MIGYSPSTLRSQMELGNRKNEAKNELKRQDIVIEVEYSHPIPYALLMNAPVHVQQKNGVIG